MPLKCKLIRVEVVHETVILKVTASTSSRSSDIRVEQADHHEHERGLCIVLLHVNPVELVRALEECDEELASFLELRQGLQQGVAVNPARPCRFIEKAK